MKILKININLNNVLLSKHNTFLLDIYYDHLHYSNVILLSDFFTTCAIICEEQAIISKRNIKSI